MANDALDPGPEGTYPHFPRDENGVPLWAPDSAIVNGKTVAGMPRGIRHRWVHDARGRLVKLTYNLTPYDADGNPIDPPVIPPGS